MKTSNHFMNVRITFQKFANKKNRGAGNLCDLPVFTPKLWNLNSPRGASDLNRVFKNFQVQKSQNFHTSTGFLFLISPIKGGWNTHLCVWKQLLLVPSPGDKTTLKNHKLELKILRVKWKYNNLIWFGFLVFNGLTWGIKFSLCKLGEYRSL